MKPQLFGFTTYFLMWELGALVGVVVGTRLAQRAGLPGRRSLVAVCCVALSILLGSKLLFLVEHGLFPGDAPISWGQGALEPIVSNGFRIPGGVLLVALTLPIICRRLQLPTLPFADAIFPAVGIALVFIRFGCFLNGCCFGRATDFPLAITFPAGAHVHYWQVSEGLIASTAAHTLPVHPLQLYFLLLGLLMYVLGRRWQETKRFDGQVWANCYLLFFGGTFLLELLRPKPLHLNLILTVAVVAVTAALAARARHVLPALARAPS